MLPSRGGFNRLRTARLSPSPKSADCIIATNARLPDIYPSPRGAKEFGPKRTDVAECQHLSRSSSNMTRSEAVRSCPEAPISIFANHREGYKIKGEQTKIRF